jgi:hypothetical protein
VPQREFQCSKFLWALVRSAVAEGARQNNSPSIRSPRSARARGRTFGRKLAHILFSFTHASHSLCLLDSLVCRDKA